MAAFVFVAPFSVSLLLFFFVVFPVLDGVAQQWRDVAVHLRATGSPQHPAGLRNSSTKLPIAFVLLGVHNAATVA